MKSINHDYKDYRIALIGSLANLGKSIMVILQSRKSRLRQMYVETPTSKGN